MAIASQRTVVDIIMRGYIALEEWHWFTGRCLSYGMNTPFLPFIELLRAVLRHLPKDEDGAAAENLGQMVERLYAPALKGTRSTARKKEIQRRRDLSIAALALLLSQQPESADVSKNPLLGLAPRERREQLFGAVTDFVGQLSVDRPTVLVFEDFQWSDEESRELLAHLVSNLQERPVLFIVAARPDTPHLMATREDFLHISLKELSASNSETLLGRLLGTERLPRALRDLILEKTEGNPFYMEEVILNLEERGMLERRARGFRLTRPIEQIEIPDTVEEVVLARLDRET